MKKIILLLAVLSCICCQPKEVSKNEDNIEAILNDDYILLIENRGCFSTVSKKIIVSKSNKTIDLIYKQKDSLIYGQTVGFGNYKREKLKEIILNWEEVVKSVGFSSSSSNYTLANDSIQIVFEINNGIINIEDLLISKDAKKVMIASKLTKFKKLDEKYY